MVCVCICFEDSTTILDLYNYKNKNIVKSTGTLSLSFVAAMITLYLRRQSVMESRSQDAGGSILSGC